MSTPGNTAKLGATHRNIQSAQRGPSLVGSEPTMHLSARNPLCQPGMKPDRNCKSLCQGTCIYLLITLVVLFGFVLLGDGESDPVKRRTGGWGGGRQGQLGDIQIRVCIPRHRISIRICHSRAVRISRIPGF